MLYEVITESVMEQMGGEAQAGSAKADTDAVMVFKSGGVVQGNMTPEPQAEYPICKGEVQDGCIV